MAELTMKDLKIGMRVQIRADLVEGAQYGSIKLFRSEAEHRGKVVTIEDIDVTTSIFMVLGSSANYMWFSLEMVECIVTETNNKSEPTGVTETNNKSEPTGVTEFDEQTIYCINPRGEKLALPARDLKGYIADWWRKTNTLGDDTDKRIKQLYRVLSFQTLKMVLQHIDDGGWVLSDKSFEALYLDEDTQNKELGTVLKGITETAIKNNQQLEGYLRGKLIEAAKKGHNALTITEAFENEEAFVSVRDELKDTLQWAYSWKELCKIADYYTTLQNGIVCTYRTKRVNWTTDIQIIDFSW